MRNFTILVAFLPTVALAAIPTALTQEVSSTKLLRRAQGNDQHHTATHTLKTRKNFVENLRELRTNSDDATRNETLEQRKQTWRTERNTRWRNRTAVEVAQPLNVQILRNHRRTADADAQSVRNAQRKKRQSCSDMGTQERLKCLAE